jgi:hypothetical protein
MVVMEDEGDKNDVLRQKRGGERQYVYDAVFGEESTQVRKRPSWCQIGKRDERKHRRVEKYTMLARAIQVDFQ